MTRLLHPLRTMAMDLLEAGLLVCVLAAIAMVCEVMR